MNPPAEESRPAGELQDAQLAISLAHALRGGRALSAIRSLLREQLSPARRRQTVARPPQTADGCEPGAAESEVLTALYGDARARHRVYDTQPSHMRQAI